MSVADELRAAHAPGAGAAGGGPALRRILVPVGLAGDAVPALALAARLCDTASGLLRLVHVRIYDPPVRGYPARFYPETRDAAAAAVDEAMLTVWGWGLRADSAVVTAPRGKVAAAIAAEAAGWDAHVIVLTRRPRTAVSRLLWGCVPDQVMRKSGCPVLAVHPGRS
jgi:nucleotide-binding universal stress UspA family protein